MYLPHPSRELNRRFEERPYQGASPFSAKFLFVGLDANYDPNLESNPVFHRVLEYQDDGIAFWQRHGVHHPFLLPEYKGYGRRYHRSVARIGFTPSHAPLVSFAELLHVPTVGRSQLAPDDLDASHLKFVNAAILEGQAEHVFVSAGVVRLMRASKAFPWLLPEPVGSQPLPILYRGGAGRRVYLHLHFSNYGKFQRQMDVEARAIAALLAENG